MIRVAIVGDIGSGKTYISKLLDIHYLMQILKSQKFTKKIKIVTKR